MVHALSEALRVLTPDGVLIDLRPAQSNRRVEVDLPEARLFIGEIDYAYRIPQHQAADAALRESLAMASLRLEHRTVFEFVVDLDTASDLRDFAGQLGNSSIPEALLRQAEALTADIDDDYLIKIRRDMVIARYRKVVDL